MRLHNLCNLLLDLQMVEIGVSHARFERNWKSHKRRMLSRTIKGCKAGKQMQAYLHIFETVLLTDDSENVLLTAFLHLSSENELIEDEVCLLKIEDDIQLADVSIIFVHLLHVSVHDFESDQFVVDRSAASDEEEGSITAIDHFCLYEVVKNVSDQTQSRQIARRKQPLYSRKLHIRVRLDRTSWETSLMILAFSLGERVMNHFANL